MNYRKLHANTHLSCEVVSIGQMGCSYMGTLSLDEHSVALFYVVDVDMDLYHKIKEMKDFIICAKTSSDCITLWGTTIIEAKFHTHSKVQICFWISDIFVGSKYAMEQNADVLFSGFSCQFTDLFELFGLYPISL